MSNIESWTRLDYVLGGFQDGIIEFACQAPAITLLGYATTKSYHHEDLQPCMHWKHLITWQRYKYSAWCIFNTLRSEQNGRHFADDIIKYVFHNYLNFDYFVTQPEMLKIWSNGKEFLKVLLNFPESIQIPMQFALDCPIDNKPTLVRVMACHRTGENPLIELTHWGRDKMAAIFQMTFSDGFSWMKMYEFWLNFHWNLFLGVQLTIFQHWFR